LTRVPGTQRKPSCWRFSSGIASKPVKILDLVGFLRAIVEGWLDLRVLMPPVE